MIYMKGRQMTKNLPLLLLKEREKDKAKNLSKGNYR